MLYHLRNNFLLSLSTGLLLSSPFSLFAANDLDLSNTPLPISASVEPNVMFLLDNSGSMDNVVWHHSYTTAAVTQDWHDGGEWDGTSTFMTIASIPSCTPSASSIQVDTDGDGNNDLTLPLRGIQATFGADTKCLTVPDILDNGETRYTGHYLDYLFTTYADDTDLSRVLPYKTRLMAMKDVTNSIIDTVSGMRFGLTVLNSNVSSGQRVIEDCGTPTTPLMNAVNGLDADGGTPLAESMYEITRYFRGLSTSNTQYRSPITASCQKNFVIAITDGLPTGDDSFDSSDPAISRYCPESSACSLPNWDQQSPATAGARFSDLEGGEGLFFDDLAKFAYDVDMRTGGDFDTPPFEIQNIETYAVGFSLDAQTLIDAGHYGSGLTYSDPQTTPDPANYFTADNEGQLLEDLNNTILSIAGRSGSASSITASTGYIGAGGTSLYQATFSRSAQTGAWTGNLTQLILGLDTATNQVTITNSDVNAADALNNQVAIAHSSKPNIRNIFTYNRDLTNPVGIQFLWDSLSANQQSQLSNREEILNYIWGVSACESGITPSTCPGGQTQNLRPRGGNYLGTIVNSTPIYIASPLEYYPPIWSGVSAPENSATETNTHEAFKNTYQDRRAIVYTGANDGMLHAFDANTMEEVFSYVPNEILHSLTSYSDLNFTHDFYVDGTPNVIDVFHGSNAGGNNVWKTVLVGGLNKGGQGIYALDITDPDRFSTSNVMWEYTDEDDRDLGYTFSRPAVIRMHNGRWAAVFGNGYNNTEIDDGDSNNDGTINISDDTDANDSSTGDAVLYIVDIHTGQLIKKISTNVGSAEDPTGSNRPNGLATVAPVDINDDFIADYIYAGDLFGNLWRFNVTSTDDDDWAIFGKGSDPAANPVFIAVDENNTPQPITARPDVTLTDTGALMIYFGTGQYLQLADRVNTNQQTFYGLLDIPEADASATTTAITTRGDMLRQIADSPTNASGETVRTYSTNGSDKYTSWYVDLPEAGERVIGPAIVRGISRKKIIFTSIVPTSDVCAFGGTSWLTELDARDGSRTSRPVFDINFDGRLNSLDSASGDVVNGWRQEGIHTTPAILTGKGVEFKILSSSTGVPRAVGEMPPLEQNGERQSWRQIK